MLSPTDPIRSFSHRICRVTAPREKQRSQLKKKKAEPVPNQISELEAMEMTYSRDTNNEESARVRKPIFKQPSLLEVRKRQTYAKYTKETSKELNNYVEQRKKLSFLGDRQIVEGVFNLNLDQERLKSRQLQSRQSVYVKGKSTDNILQTRSSSVLRVQLRRVLQEKVPQVQFKHFLQTNSWNDSTQPQSQTSYSQKFLPSLGRAAAGESYQLPNVKAKRSPTRHSEKQRSVTQYLTQNEPIPDRLSAEMDNNLRITSYKRNYV